MPTLVVHHQNGLHLREPALISLPLYLPSIPILNPLVTPLIEGAKVAQPSPTITQPPASPPQETPTAVDPSPTNTGSGGDSGSGNEGSGSGDSGQSGNEGSGNGDSGIGTNSIPSTGGGEGSNSGATGTSSGVAQAPSGIGESVSGGATPSSSSSPSSGGNILADGNTPEDAANDPSSGNSGGGSSSGSASVGSGSMSGNGNEDSGSGNGGPTLVGASIGIPGVTGMPAATGVGGGIRGGNSGGNGNGNTVSTGAEEKHGLSGGAIGGIIIAALLAVAFIVLLLRRRFRSRRSERRKQWWFSRDGTAQAYGDRDAVVDGSGGITVFAGGQRRSVRSSFETTVDYSATPRLGENFDIPSLPPMAELRGTPVLVNLDSPVVPPVEMRPLVKVTPESRFSVGTVSSIGSDGQGQWLVVNRDPLAQEVGTPMSVRPFSPTESFAFPKPPTEKNSGDWGSQFSRPTSLHTLSASGIKNINGYGICGSVAEEVPALPVPSPAANPFNDPDPIILYSTAAAALGANPGPDNPGTLDKVNAVTVNSSTDPFADPEPKTPSTVNPEFMEVETIKRPFVPSLGDELSVDLGDRVRILQLFDDGWALVEKNPVHGPASVKGKGKEPDRGLIPIDCFRDHGVELSTFISSKRTSLRCTNKMAEHDLSKTIIPYLDRHLVFPLLMHLVETQLFPVEEVTQAQYELARGTNMFDYAVTLFRQLHPDEEVPAEFEGKRQNAVSTHERLQQEAQAVLDVIEKPEVAQALRQDKNQNLQYLRDNHQLTLELIAALYNFGQFQYSYGNYSGAADYLYHFRILSTNVDLATSAHWGKLASDILTGKWDTALEELNSLRDFIDSRSSASILAAAAAANVSGIPSSKTEPALVQLHSRTWLVHWSLFIYFNHEQGRTLLLETFLSPTYLNTIQTACPWILRYLVVAAILSRKTSSTSSSANPVSTRVRNAIREVVKVVQMEEYQYQDPVTSFLKELYVEFDFEAAQRELQRAEEVVKNDFFLGDFREEFLDNARYLISEAYCRIHQRIDIGDLSKRLNLDENDGEKWIANLIRETRMGADAKIDLEKNIIEINRPALPVYQTVIEKTRGVAIRTQALGATISRSGQQPTQQQRASTNEAKTEGQVPITVN